MKEIVDAVYLSIQNVTNQIDKQAHEISAKVDEYARWMMSAPRSALFEELGLYYIGPIDGHNVEDLVTIFQKVKSMPAPGPVLIHIVTVWRRKERDTLQLRPLKTRCMVRVCAKLFSFPWFLHRSYWLTVSCYRCCEVWPKNWEAIQDKVTYSFIHSILCRVSHQRGRAAMGGGTGLNFFQKKFPERCFDVGIAEQHAVTFAAGLATEGLKPFCAIYSSFLQRGSWCGLAEDSGQVCTR